jgi:hypothetical protein
MKKRKDIVFFAPPAIEKPKVSHIDHIKGLFHYFGYEPTTAETGGFIAFEHKVFIGNRVIYAKHHGCLCKVTFSEPVSGSFVGSQSSLPKTWAGLFTAVRNHTRRVITMFDHEEAKLKAA